MRSRHERDACGLLSDDADDVTPQNGYFYYASDTVNAIELGYPYNVRTCFEKK
ncbi:hypothetical protein O9H85_30720 [Paenibacillus filicis]|uniref:Uncharacterized protein n=1 Tax=Paenibacillus gyeongsangnamensis TaxID=3388067 RepID=A0ABT4QIK5_9BACL|nr:hypothetical protein [Paenibacillus filicis]MCZ8516680.1 hypothetical protein [Paenibacillus filicis]